MTIRELKSPDNITAKGSSLIIELPFAECNFVAKALSAFEDTGNLTDDERFFIWQFKTVKHILSDGNIDSIDCDVFNKKFRKQNSLKYKVKIRYN